MTGASVPETALKSCCKAFSAISTPVLSDSSTRIVAGLPLSISVNLSDDSSVNDIPLLSIAFKGVATNAAIHSKKIEFFLIFYILGLVC
ncbi:MAG: hypothetical protein BWY95_01688 [Bacteroidetes bacterium ADurb.BinA104]|nr:MAG: hypothetical protein BWY95_01688 [Bacteroidetes bacterium ADurb.BinA104]